MSQEPSPHDLLAADARETAPEFNTSSGFQAVAYFRTSFEIPSHARYGLPQSYL